MEANFEQRRWEPTEREAALIQLETPFVSFDDTAELYRRIFESRHRIQGLLHSVDHVVEPDLPSRSQFYIELDGILGSMIETIGIEGSNQASCYNIDEIERYANGYH